MTSLQTVITHKYTQKGIWIHICTCTCLSTRLLYHFLQQICLCLSACCKPCKYTVNHGESRFLLISSIAFWLSRFSLWRLIYIISIVFPAHHQAGSKPFCWHERSGLSVVLSTLGFVQGPTWLWIQTAIKPDLIKYFRFWWGAEVHYDGKRKRSVPWDDVLGKQRAFYFLWAQINWLQGELLV